MEIMFTLTAMETAKEARTVTYGRIALSEGIVELPGLALYRAIKNEVDGMTADLRPYLVQAVYNALLHPAPKEAGDE